MRAPTHGLVHDDLRHLSRLEVEVEGCTLEVLASSTPDTAVGGGRRHASERPTSARHRRADPPPVGRRRAARGPAHPQHVVGGADWTVRVAVAADFAHVFDVKAGGRRATQPLERTRDGWAITARRHRLPPPSARRHPARTPHDLEGSTLTWHLDVAPRSERAVCITVEPVVDGVPAGLAFPCGVTPADAIPLRRLEAWRAASPPSPPPTRGSRSSSIRRSSTSPPCGSWTGAPGPGRHRRRRALVHDPVRPRLPAHVVDAAAVRRRAGARGAAGAWPTSRARSTTQWPRSSQARSSTSSAATAAAARSRLASATTAPSTPRRCSSCSPPRRGGGAPSTPSDLAGWRRPSTLRSTGCSDPGIRRRRVRRLPAP